MKNQKKISVIFLIAALLLFACSYSSCRKDEGPVIVVPPNTSEPPVSFANDIQPIFNTKCISCHDEYHVSLNLKSCCSFYELWFTGGSAPYVDTAVPVNSILYKRITGAILPQMPLTGSLTQYEEDLILRWIEEGAKNN